MDILNIPIGCVKPAPWNPNEVTPAMMDRLRHSIKVFGLVEPIVVRAIGGGTFEAIGGNHRLAIIKELGWTEVPCLIVEATDARARLLGQALNHISGIDNPGRRSVLIKEVLSTTSKADVLALLPDSARRLHDLCKLDAQTMAESLAEFEKKQGARLSHLNFQMTKTQLAIVQRALRKVTPEVKGLKGTKNIRGAALSLLCERYLDACEGDPDEQQP